MVCPRVTEGQLRVETPRDLAEAAWALATLQAHSPGPSGGCVESGVRGRVALTLLSCGIADG